MSSRKILSTGFVMATFAVTLRAGAAAALLAGMDATAALAAGAGGGGHGFGLHILGPLANPGLPSLNGVPNANSRSTPLLNFVPSVPSSPAGSIAGPGSVPKTLRNPTQQGTTQSLGFLGNYPGAAKNGPASIAYSGGYAYAGRSSTNASTPMPGTPVSLSDDQKARLNNNASPQSVSSQQAQRQSSDNGIDLKVGTRVRLRAGSPMMVVTSTHDSEVTCVWFNSFGQAESGTFPAASLM